MIRALFYVIGLSCNCILTSGHLLPPSSDLKVLKASRNDYGYLLKRNLDDNFEDADSKERRSNMGSSFIRFGRSNPMEKYNSFEQNEDSKTERQTRTRPDVIIRFGRSGQKQGQTYDRHSRGDLKFIRFGRNYIPTNLDLSLICSDVPVDSETYEKGLRFFPTRLARLCNELGLSNDRYEFISDEQAEFKQE
ncbi:FMRFamide-related peptides-like [Leptopilina boulardi]|uniref:FMRFamide-related peptides-like n=1 Tax=Leptopilina boulardi TaxID=63433 RepID=UPI0021F5446B|nr:FMRFamide-related peptides-like [Leptopilina boulardi]